MNILSAYLASRPAPICNAIRIPMIAASSIIMAALIECAFSATSASRDGISWNWNENREVGQYVNGDWWVVGPVTITGITRPNNTPGLDGSMLGPTWMGGWPSQGFDNRMENLTYAADLNVANSLPRTLPVNSTLISSISAASASELDKFRGTRPLLKQAGTDRRDCSSAKRKLSPPLCGKRQNLNVEC